MNATLLADPKLVTPQASLDAPSSRFTEIRPRSGVIVGGIALGALFGIAGVGIVVVILQTARNPLWCVLGFALVLVGVAIMLLMRRLASLRILVSDHGLAILTLGPGRPGRCYHIQSPGLQPRAAARRVPDQNGYDKRASESH
jgi:hypothetical protein